jgi:signal transduction histidine kinase
LNAEAKEKAAVLQTYADYEQGISVRHLRVGCLLVVALMPLGILLDYFVYPEKLGQFLTLRIACSALEGIVWVAMGTQAGRKYSQTLGLVIALLPVFFICWMIAVTDGPASPYYAGLNLILLAIAFVLRWSVGLSFLALVLFVAMYLAACLSAGPLGIRDRGVFFNNLYFLCLTGIIVITGSRIHRSLRVREFTLRYELDKNKQMLEESNQKLKELDQIKSRFFANISHELRTPLTLLIAPLEALLQKFNLDPETKELLGTMHSNGMRLLKLINDLLDLVRLESGRMEVRREPMHVDEFVRGIASSARQMANDKRLRFETFVGPGLDTILADRDKLEKILFNLVFNALKFTPSGGRVEVRAEREGEEFVLRVIDTGMGISEKNIGHVFDRFWQADDSSRRKYQGVGIGLALVKDLAQIQGGDVDVKSQEGKGTTFTVRLPYQEAAVIPVVEATSESDKAQGSANPGGTVSSEEWLTNLYRRAELFPAVTSVQQALRPVETARKLNRPTILVADDEPDMLRFLKSQLQQEYNVLEAVDGQQAIEKAGQFLPNLILLDMMMPEKDGLQACREIRDRTSTQSIPVVLLTARADEETKLKALQAGASDFLTKPFSGTELRVRLKNLIESHEYQRKLSKQNQVLETTIEQLKDTETQLVQTEKLASLGRMSAGIIHEINNPLNFATTGLFTLRNKGKYLAPDQQEEYQEVLKDVEDGIKRVKNIVSDLRMFTHPETESRDQVEVAEVVAASLRFLSSEWKDKVLIEKRLADHQTIWANKNKLIHVLVNLLQNALDAMKDKAYAEGEKPCISLEGRVQNGRSLLIIRDNGTGIDSKHVDKIFDPFFTTKDVGEGMGLGLSICYRIVQDCDGRIAVRTEPGKFCEFTLEFPEKGVESAVPAEPQFPVPQTSIPA